MADHLYRSESVLRSIAALGAGDPTFWSFQRAARRDLSHSFFQYPAMMVPRMLSAILEKAAAQLPSQALIVDPFVGSGTTLVESMKLGFQFAGIDINPLAILICQAKSLPHHCDALEQHIGRTHQRAATDQQQRLEARFSSLPKWFSRTAAIHLSKLRRAIRQTPYLWARRFLWVALAETVRLTSNARTTTFKLHIRPRAELDSRPVDVLSVFQEVAGRNLSRLREQRLLLSTLGRLERGRYNQDISLTIDDVARSSRPAGESADLLITSPPYGDNTSTVTYGQHSFLPLQWIDLDDIDAKADHSVLCTTHELDSRSLGGHRRITQGDIDRLSALSGTLATTLGNLRTHPRDRLQRIASYYRDLTTSLPYLISLVKPGAPMIWIVGSRHVGGLEIDMSRILGDLLAAHGCHLFAAIGRRIPSKRMAYRNNISSTVHNEHILLATSPDDQCRRGK